jgi:hypothetical protein
LIELMVAIGLGLLILLGVGTLFLASNQSSRSARNIASAEETSQILLYSMATAVGRAGYSEIVGTGATNMRADLLFNGAHIRGCTGAGFANPLAGDFSCGAAVVGASDTLMVAFQSDNAVGTPQSATLDCLGQAAVARAANPDYAARAAGAGGNVDVVQNIYFAAGGNLSCQGDLGTAVVPVAPQVLAGGVELFKVYFGFDDALYASPFDATLVNRPTARSIRSGAQIAGLPDPGPGLSRWDFVVSVILCVEIASLEPGVTAEVAQYRPCPRTANEAAGVDPINLVNQPAADGRIRRSYTQVVSLRSRIAPLPVRVGTDI